MSRTLCTSLFSFVESSGTLLPLGDDAVLCVVFAFNVEEDSFVHLLSSSVWVTWIFQVPSRYNKCLSNIVPFGSADLRRNA